MDSAAERDFTAFYDATWRRTVAVAYAMTGELSAAEDLAQEAYSRAWPRWSALQSYDDPGAWVRQVTSRLAISRWRRTKTAMNFLARSRVPDPAAPPGETSIVLVQALRTLPEGDCSSVPMVERNLPGNVTPGCIVHPGPSFVCRNWRRPTRKSATRMSAAAS